MPFGIRLVLCLLVVGACSACTSTHSMTPAAITSTVGGEVIAASGTSVTIREARSRRSIVIDLSSIAPRSVAIGDCLLVSGTWRGDANFTATAISSVRPGCRDGTSEQGEAPLRLPPPRM